ncbi:hypothetical protein F8388_013316 [Cannabis sativa]|uniref:RNase H type-1 domain-containing protein n=1 Tax=Cannabis sativa TaxID=3483 RepID=A0A7J6FEE1_CANSA|nr:hypothetical protein F8388_013316 [Cannabis sativa]KAF4402455.1 hypothetical protein G4B88_012240 [Cannabis sativa]
MLFNSLSNGVKRTHLRFKTLNCQTLVHDIRSGHTNNIHLQELLIKIISLLSSLPQASISYIPREANSAAHHLAKQALRLEQQAIL